MSLGEIEMRECQKADSRDLNVICWNEKLKQMLQILVPKRGTKSGKGSHTADNYIEKQKGFRDKRHYWRNVNTQLWLMDWQHGLFSMCVKAVPDHWINGVIFPSFKGKGIKSEFKITEELVY